MSATPSIFSERFGGMMDRLRQLTGSPTFTWKKKEVPCVVNSYARQTILTEGGFEVECDAKIFVRKNQFLTIDSTLVTIDSELFTMDNDLPIPVAGKRVVLAGKTLKIVRTWDPIPTDPLGSWALYLKDPTQ